MVKISPVEELFTVINETALIIQEEISCTFLEALAVTGENLFQGTVIQEGITELNKKRLEKLYSQVQMSKYQKEEIRKAFQLVILKGMKDSVQPNHQMTPDAIGMIMGYLVGKFVTNKNITLFDPAIGTGNLMATVINQLQDKEIDAIGIDVDDLLIRLAYVNANLHQHSIELFNQDSIAPLYVDPVDVVICDLPVGYYPNDDRAIEFVVCADKGHTYAHHLLIEQSVLHTKDGGYLFFIIPNGLFESEQAPKLRQLLKDRVNIQGILQLPLSIFKSEQAAKSILILQKKGEGVVAPKQALLVNMPSLSNMQAVEKIFAQIDFWLKENK